MVKVLIWTMLASMVILTIGVAAVLALVNAFADLLGAQIEALIKMLMLGH